MIEITPLLGAPILTKLLVLNSLLSPFNNNSTTPLSSNNSSTSLLEPRISEGNNSLMELDPTIKAVKFLAKVD